MREGVEWGLWIAGIGLLVAAAKFLDDYHIKADTKTKARDLLVRAFIFLDRPRVVNVPAVAYHFVALRLSRRLGPFGYIIFWIGCYIVVVATFYLGRRLLEPNWEYPFPRYALTWIDSVYWACFMLFAVGTASASYFLVGFLTRRWNHSATLLGQGSFMLLTVALLLTAAATTLIGFLTFGYLNHHSGLPIAGGSGVALGNPVFLFFLTVLCLWHLVFLSTTMIALTLFRAVYLLAHKSIATVLDAASNPKISPFQYLATMLALFGVAFKVIEVLVK